MLKKYYIILFAALIGLNACSPTKRLVEGEYLLSKNELLTNGIELSKEELQEIIKQQPNRKILPFARFHLHMNNLPSDGRLNVSRVRKDARVARKNAKRALKGKKEKPAGRTKWEWMKEVVGEPPVIVDTMIVKESSRQLSTYLVKKGYFINQVTDSITYREKKKLAKVYYSLNWEEPYTVDTIRKRIDDPVIRRIIERDFKFKTVFKGKRFDVDDLSVERSRVTSFLRNRGFFRFTGEYIEFEVDSTYNNRAVSVDLIIGRGPRVIHDSTDLVTHTRYNIGNVYFNYDFDSSNDVDTLFDSGYYFLGFEHYPLKRKVLIQNTFLRPGMRYESDKVDMTYRRLSGLSILGHVTIRFEEYDDILDVFITLAPARRQAFSIESQGTNTGGFLGIEGNLVYRHKNIFKGAETMEIRLNGGVQAQALVTETSSGVAVIESGDQINLNTLEFGPSFSLKIPKFLLPVAQDKFAKSANPSTLFLASYNYQDRQDFTRSLSSLNFGYEWKESIKKTHLLNPLELSVIRIDKSNGFQERLNELNDQFLSDSYQNHFITASSYTYTYNGQKQPRSKNLFSFRGHGEIGGNILRGLYNLSGQEKDSLGSYQIFGIRFAQYFKTYSDLRFYRVFDDKRVFATRLYAGVGVPLKNLNVIPFSKSFYGGGANGLRAWRARTIGPGGFFEPVVTYDKIGDVQIEANVEYRFNLINYLDGAFFVDAGNIWLLNPDDLRPLGNFTVDRFLSEMAIGAGVGLRVDFSYFLLRFDLASQIKDPSLESGERWIFEPKGSYNRAVSDYNDALNDGSSELKRYGMRWNFNLGIGYPF